MIKQFKSAGRDRYIISDEHDGCTLDLDFVFPKSRALFVCGH